MAGNKDIIVVGGSSGSRPVLQRLLAGLPGDLPASIFVTTHVPAWSSGSLSAALADVSRLKVLRATDEQPIERACVYVAPPDRHLLLLEGVVRLGDGPRENMARPAIDPLFRSAALSYGGRVIGVILSGLLNDGAAGLRSVKSCGGAAVVQHPLDAEADQMPLSALQVVEVDHVASMGDLAPLITDLTGAPAGPAHRPSDELRLEVEIAAGARLGSARLRQIADPSPLSCPDCQGVLSEIRGPHPLRFRCQIGHAYTADALSAALGAVDEAIRVAMRVMEERVTLVERMAEEARQAGRLAVAELYASRSDEYRRYAAVLREAATSSLGQERASRAKDG